MDTKRKKILIFGGIVIIIGVLFTVNYLKANTLNNLNFEITAQNIEKNEIATDTNFIIKSEKDYSKNLIKKVVSVEPEINYSLSKTSKGTYLISPEEKLNDSSIYNIYINDADNKPVLSWAFQTKADFEVINTTPYSDSTYIENNSAIEIYFSKPVNDIEKYFEIFPKTEGKFEYSEKKVTFIPNELLKNDTVYEITIKKGLKSYYGDELTEDHEFSFRTKPITPYIGIYGDYQQSFITGKSQSINLYADNDYVSALFDVNIYKLNSVKEYVSYLETHYKNVNKSVGYDYDHNFDMSKHTPVCSYTTVLQESGYKNTLEIPEELPEGWYIADIRNTLNNIHLQKAIQVTDISLYTYGLDKDVRIWINDTQTGEAVSGATVQVGDLAAVSNKDGLADFSIYKDDRQKIIITTKDGKEFGEYLKLTESEETSLKDDYYMYLYTDRKQYLPTDTINYWGVIIPRKNGVEKLKEVTVKIAEDIEEKVKVDENGAFYGSINFVNHISTWGAVFISAGDRESYMRDIQISDYIKPVYKLSSVFDKEYYRKGEKIGLSVYGRFYDGTSAENIKVKVNQGGTDNYKTTTLDKNGEGKVVLEPELIGQDGRPTYIYSTLEISGIDESTTSYNSVLYFPTDYAINSSWNSKDKNLTLSTNKINYEAVSENNIDYNKIYTGESFEQNIYAELIESYTEKRYTGESLYNSYTATYEPQYVYDRVENVVDTYNWTINTDEKFTANISKAGENEKSSYELKIYYTYPDGFVGTDTVYLYSNYYYDNNSYHFEADKSSIKENETTRLTLSGSEKLTGGRMLYIVSTDRINTIGTTANKYMDIKMSKELIPNFYVTGAFFDGKAVHKIYGSYIYFNTEDRELSIDIKTDKESYRPGDSVKVTAKVTDKSGKPVQANFLFSVVDEAALADTYEESVLNKIYQERYHYPLIFSSDESKELGGEGGGGGDEIRDTFTDVLTFTPIYTNENGEAEVTFDVSDDLTSWRITGIAISNDLYAGKTKKNIVTSIPFFINQVLNSKYTVKNDIVTTLRVAGADASNLTSSVKYDIELINSEDKVVKTESKELKASETYMLNLGKQETGKYKLKVIATSEDKRDALQKEFEVVESLHEISLVNESTVYEMKNIDALRYPVRLMFFDKNNGFYYRALMKILEDSYGRTNEQILGKNYAKSKLNEFYGEEIYDISDNISLQYYDGGISKISQGSADTLFTAQVTANAGNYINTSAAKEYFNDILNGKHSLASEVTAAYMGLAALKQPVLVDVKYLLDNGNGLELLDKINLINALAYIGDYSSANEYYEKEIKPLMSSSDDEKYINSSYETYSYQATSRILPTLALIKHEDFEKTLQYVLKNSTEEYMPIMDLMTVINNYIPTKNTNSKMTYSLLGKSEKVDFSKEKIRILELDKKEFESFKLENVKGDVRVIAEYIGSSSEVKLKDNGIKITKTISKGELGEYSTVTLNIEFPENKEKYYVLDDVIPASSRFASGTEYHNTWHLFDQEMQKVRFYVYPYISKNVTVTYKIRNIFLGEFMVEPAYITSESGKMSKSEDAGSLTFNVK